MPNFTNVQCIGLLSCYLLIHVPLSGQTQGWWKKMDKQGTMGLVNGNLNFKDNVASGFSFGFGTNLFSINSSSLSLLTNIKFGCENKYGLGYLALAANMISPGSVSTDNNPNLTDFAEFPISLHYNYGYGSGAQSQKNFGFFFGGGMSYVITGYNNGAVSAYSTSFWGYSMEAGIRFNHFELGLSKVISLSGPIAAIPNPAFYELNLSIFFGTWQSK
jgi:hypothetical protein